MVPQAISRLWWKRYLRRNATSWDELDRFPQLRPDEQRKQLAERLLRQIRYFGTRADALPEWREAAKIDEPEELWRIWPELPVITKNDLRNRFPAAEMEALRHCRPSKLHRRFYRRARPLFSRRGNDQEDIGCGHVQRDSHGMDSRNAHHHHLGIGTRREETDQLAQSRARTVAEPVPGGRL